MGRFTSFGKRVGLGVLVLSALTLGGAGIYAGYASATAHERLYFPETPRPAIRASSDPAVIERGRYLVRGPAHCSQCHSVADRNDLDGITPDAPLTGGLAFEMGPIGTRYSANLTPDRDTGIGLRTDAELARTIRSGVLPDGELSIMMRYGAARLSDDDLVAVISYLRSLPPLRRATPRGEWSFAGKLMLPLVTLAPRSGPAPAGMSDSREPSVERGRYLAEDVMLCTGCHSRHDMSTFEPIGPKGGGSDPEPSHGDDSDMEFVAPNLTRHPTGVTGRFDEEHFLARMRLGRRFASSIMPWENFNQTSDVDLRSVYRYLRSLPPIDRDVGPTYRRQGSIDR